MGCPSIRYLVEESRVKLAMHVQGALQPHLARRHGLSEQPPFAHRPRADPRRPGMAVALSCVRNQREVVLTGRVAAGIINSRI